MFDIARLHAALNDLPAALLVAGLVFDLLGAFTQRDSLKAAGFWMLMSGTIGAGLALASGLLAERVVEHGDQMHAVMEQHQTLAIATTVLFGLVASWRLIRKGRMGPREQPVLLTAGVIGVALLVATAQRGGILVFDYAGGLPTTSLERAMEDRGSHRHAGGESPEHADTGALPAVVPPDSAPHRHAPGTPPHEH